MASSNTSQVFVIVGASRGIGFEMVKQLSSRPSTIVYAGVRSPSSAAELQQLAASHSNVRVISTDLANSSSIVSAADEGIFLFTFLIH
jgi:NAD(P)-dependent dehydrogenase (short-subunit alcohol dehydrogenase family)